MDLKSQFFDWVLLAGLLFLATVFMFTQNRSLTRALRTHTLEATARIESSFAWMSRYLRALDQNRKLRRRNIELSSKVARTRSVRMRNRELRRMLQLRDSSSARLRAARIVTKDIFQQENFLTLNVGRDDGVREGMAVVHQRGIIGTVMLVSDDFARVMPFLNTDFRVPGIIKPLRAEGIVRWDGERHDRLLLEHVVKTEPVQKGQPVVTSGHSDVFPRGRAIGTVDSVKSRQGRSELLIYLTPSVPLREIGHAFVILHSPDPDRTALEAETVGS